MRVRAQNRANKFMSKPRPHREGRNQRRHGQSDAKKADPCHRGHAPLSTAGAQVAQGDHKFKPCKRARGTRCRVGGGSGGHDHSFARLPGPDLGLLEALYNLARVFVRRKHGIDHIFDHPIATDHGQAFQQHLPRNLKTGQPQRIAQCKPLIR